MYSADQRPSVVLPSFSFETGPFGRLKNLKNFEKKLKKRIQIHFKENFSSYPKELKNNIINGIIIYGFLEAFK